MTAYAAAILDPCSQSQWDAFHRGEAQPAQPAKARLAALDLEFIGGHLAATRFDGAVGAQP